MTKFHPRSRSRVAAGEDRAVWVLEDRVVVFSDHLVRLSSRDRLQLLARLSAALVVVAAGLAALSLGAGAMVWAFLILAGTAEASRAIAASP